MFIYSLKASTLRFAAVICVALVALIMLIAFVPTYTSGDSQANTQATSKSPGASTQVDTQKTVEIDYTGIKSAADAAEFLSQFGITADASAAETVTVKLPDAFDKIFAGYNELQKSQGLDLSKYKGKTVTRYTFTLPSFADWDGKVYANILVYKNKVIGGDICSADPSGFVRGFNE